MLRPRLWSPLRDESGFTLVELLGVAVILVILALMALPVYAEVTDKVREARSQDELSHIEQALDSYYAFHGTYPPRLGTLVVEGYMKPTSFHSALSSTTNYYYALGHRDGKLIYLVGDPGPEPNCSLSPSPCGTDPFTQDAPVDQQTEPSLKYVRRSR